SRGSTRALTSADDSTLIISRTARSIARSRSSSVMDVSQRRQLFLQEAPCFGDSPLEGAYRNLEHLCDLVVRLFAGARHEQRIAQLARQRRHELPQGSLQLVARESRFVRWFG